jgi:L-rhamnose mutarotase
VLCPACCCTTAVTHAEIEQQILASGILSCQIYRLHNRLCMILDTSDDFSFERKAAMDAAHEPTQKWEQLMWTYQQALPGAKPGEQWQLMDKIYNLSSTASSSSSGGGS